MRKRMSVALNLVLATVLAWTLLGGAPGHSAGRQIITIAAPAFRPIEKSSHNGGLATITPACGAAQALVPGDEHAGDLNAAKGSFLAFLRLPDGAKVTGLSLYANDFDTEDSHAFLVRKRITPGTHPKESGYVTMAAAKSAGAVDSTIRKFTDTTIDKPTVNNTDFEYFVELVVCGATEPFAVQVVTT